MLLLAGIVISCQSDLDKVGKVPMDSDAPDRVIEQAEYFYTDSGITRNRLRAGLLKEYFTEPPRTELSKGVELLFYRAGGVEGSVLTAREGSIRNNGRLMEVRDKVKFKNFKGEILETEKLTWEQDSDLVYTEDPVRIIRKSDTIHGVGLFANEDFSKYTIKNPSGKVYVEPDGKNK
jgi:LPS export ABC transporter protein LptC